MIIIGDLKPKSLGLMVCVIFGPLVDRLCHKALLINMSGPSYRVLETKKLNEKISVYKQTFVIFDAYFSGILLNENLVHFSLTTYSEEVKEEISAMYKTYGQ